MSASLISPAADAMIIDFEIGSQVEYEAEGSHPSWPGGASGITLGVGADIGYMTTTELLTSWAALGTDILTRLSVAVGRKGSDAEALLPSLRGIVIPYTVAADVFENTDIPRTVALVQQTFPNTGILSPDSMGALVSLVFNRGADCSNTPSRREMYEILLDMQASKPAGIPDLIRAMKRLWVGVPDCAGLLTRRDAEAALFQKGLASVPSPTNPGSSAVPAPAPPVAPVESPPAAVVPNVSRETPPVDDVPTQLLVRGMPINDLVRRAQILLANLSPAPLYTGAIDGDFGAKTETGVEKFQQTHGLYTDGKIGTETWAALLAGGVT